MRKVEALAHEVVEAAIQEDSFEVYLDEGPKTPLQEAVTRLHRAFVTPITEATVVSPARPRSKT